MKIALLGYGRMGKTIEKIAVARGHEIVLKIGSHNSASLNKESLQKADVAIDFSLPHTAFDNITLCFEANTPVVSGTTGWLDKYEQVINICKEKNAAFFYASNFSIGVNIFMEINRNLARLMNKQTDYEVTMDEIHHIHKLDAPSGTAISLANEIIGAVDRKNKWALKENDTEEDSAQAETLKIQSYREGEVPGTHIIQYNSNIDTIQIKHEAKGREGFAQGAVLAAEWLLGKNGIFSMRDMLQIK